MLCLSCFALALLAGPPQIIAQDDSDIEFIATLLGDPDPEMRAAGLDEVRERMPGEAATKAFAALLPKLPLDGQVDLLDALSDRGDAAARPAVLEMVKNEQEKARTAAIKALGALGNTTDVALLAGKAATGDESEQTAAAQSLARLRGEGVNDAVVGAMDGAEPGVQVVLLAALAARNATDALPTVLASAEDEDASVRVAAVKALRFLADESHAADIVKILKAAGDDTERTAAKLALLVLCSRGGEGCAAPIIAGMADADAASQIALLHALARCSGDDALAEVVARLGDDDEAVADEAMRMLSIWHEKAAAPHLLDIAQTSDNARHQTLAIRGLARMAAAKEGSEEEAAPADVALLSETMPLARRSQEKRLVLGVLGSAADAEALALAAAALDDDDVAADAALAAVLIAEKIEEGDKDAIRSAMEKVQQSTAPQDVRDRAKKVVGAL